MHIKEIAEQVSKVRGKETNRNSMESSLMRHMKDADQPKVKKVGPSTYALTALGVKPKSHTIRPAINS